MLIVLDELCNIKTCDNEKCRTEKACQLAMTAPKDEVYTGAYPKCIKDNGLCGVGGFCDVCPHVINNQDELSVEEQAALAKWPLDVMLNYLKNFSTEQAIANTVYLRRLQQMEAELDANDKILDQHIAAPTPPTTERKED